MKGEHSDCLIWHGRRCRLLTRPLGPYRVTWVVEDDRLYISALDATPVADLFPESPGVVPASWYSGTLRIAEGDALGPPFAGGEAPYERETFLVLDKGSVVAQAEVTWRPRVSVHAGPPARPAEEEC